jgi:hypothetical protein
MNLFYKKSIITLFFIGFFSIFNIAQASNTNGINVNLIVGSCNNNGICEEGSEDMVSCPLDCTPLPPPPPKDKPSTGGYNSSAMFQNLTIEVGYTTAIIKWNSVIPVSSSVEWGTSPDYKDGITKNINYLFEHKVVLLNLKPNTLYYFNITVDNLFGVKTKLENQIFKTLSLPDSIPPANPTNVNATNSKNGITVNWKNPKDLDFDYIRVMRSEDRFHSSPFDGYVVYEGKGSYFLDSKVVLNKKYFYTLFSRDTSGNFSSGSLISVLYTLGGEKEIIPKDDTVVASSDIYKIIQEEIIYDFKVGHTFSVSGDKETEVKTNYISKTKDDDIWVMIKNSEGEIEGKYFFGNIRDENKFITAVLPVFERGGYYEISVHRYIKGIERMVNKGVLQVTKVTEKEYGYGDWYFIKTIIIIVVLSFLFVLILILVLRRIFKFIKKRLNEEKNSQK